MSDNQFILQSAKIESKPDVGRKTIKAKGRKRTRKGECFPIRTIFWLAAGVSLREG
jgi:hypothetical protein